MAVANCYEHLLNEHLLSGTQGARWWAAVQQKTTSEIEIEKFISHRNNTACFEGPHGEVKQGSDRVRCMGHMPLLGSSVECFEVLRLKQNWSIQSTKSRGFGKLRGSYLRGEVRKGSGRLLLTRTVGEVILGTYICLWLCGLLSRTYTCVNGLVSV